MSDVVVTTPLTERLPATPHATVGTDSHSAVSTFSHGWLTAWHTCVAVTWYVFDLAEWIHVTIAADAALDSRPAFRLPAFFFSEGDRFGAITKQSHEKNPRYSQMAGRHELFEQERHSEPVPGWHSCDLACAGADVHG